MLHCEGTCEDLVTASAEPKLGISRHRCLPRQEVVLPGRVTDGDTFNRRTTLLAIRLLTKMVPSLGRQDLPVQSGNLCLVPISYSRSGNVSDLSKQRHLCRTGTPTTNRTPRPFRQLGQSTRRRPWIFHPHALLCRLLLQTGPCLWMIFLRRLVLHPPPQAHLAIPQRLSVMAACQIPPLARIRSSPRSRCSTLADMTLFCLPLFEEFVRTAAI